MREILLGTTNPAKVRRFEELLEGYPVRFLTLKDLNIIEEPEETGQTPEENAALKAQFYGKYFDAVICQDSGLYFDALKLSDPRQPGLNIRTPNGGKRLNDEEMIAYYSNFLHSMKDELGERPLVYYLNGMAVWYQGRVKTFMESRENARRHGFYMVEKPSEIRREGWPLDSLSLDPNTLNYYLEMEASPYKEEKADAEEDTKKNKVLVEYGDFAGFLVKALELS